MYIYLPVVCAAILRRPTPDSAHVGKSKFTCESQVIPDTLFGVRDRPISAHRSGCPVNICLERFGDRWSLLILRDMMVRAYSTFKEFETSGEGIATNTLSVRLRKLEEDGIISSETDSKDRRRVNYWLTEKGIDLAPVMLELLIWGAKHEETAAPCSVIATMADNREAVLAEVRRRWQERDPVPFLPPFTDNTKPGSASGNGMKQSKSRSKRNRA